MSLVLLVTALAVVLIAGFTRYSIAAGFSAYVARSELSRVDSLAPLLEWEYAQRNGWERLRSDPDAMWWLIAFNERRNGRPGPPDRDALHGSASDRDPHHWSYSPGRPDGPPGAAPSSIDPHHRGAPPEGEPDNLPPDATPPRIPTPLPSEGVPGRPPDDGFDRERPEAQRGAPPVEGAERPEQRDKRPPPFPPIRNELFRRIGVFDAQRKLIWGDPAAAKATKNISLHRGRRIIGYLSLAPAERLTAEMERDFVDDQNRNLLGVCIVAFSLSAVAGLLMSQDLVGAIKILVQGTRNLTDGNYKTRINLMRTDELGQLAQDFNRLADTLEEQDRVHRQWIADTSHELRTPIAVLRAQVEALQDGVQEANPRTLSVLHGEIMTLSKLVDDLYLLAKADVGKLRYDFVPVDLNGLLLDLVEAFDDRFVSKQIELEVESLDRPRIIDADSSRLRQLFHNLLENSLRYTNSGGKVRITLKDEAGLATVWIDDTPPGISDELLPKIFERFFRAELSRSRDFGGAGLGLAICRTIVEGHHGNIAAMHSPLGGLRVEIKFPLAEGRTHG